jgi:predicted unusual protein kinase regulating ubiquinone biosynthesis (AarF/ABC1/UbiB family)
MDHMVHQMIVERSHMSWLINQRDAVGQAVADTRALLADGVLPLDPLALSVRLGDLARSNSLLPLEANLKTLEQYSRLIRIGRRSTRALAFATLAADILSGYLLLDRRSRLWGRLTQPQDWEWQHERSATRVRDAAATLRGTLIKACQFASTRPDILPLAYVRSFATLQDHVPAYPWKAIRRTIQRELGQWPEDVFARIERRPIASASIAQVHRAWLHDGRQVAVKVQYPDIAGIITTDLILLRHIAREVARFVPDVQLQPILDHLSETLPLELDFRREASAMAALRAALLHRADVLVPEVIAELSTDRLLVTEFVDGIKITDTAALESAGVSPTAVARLLNDVYAEQIFRHGWLHADPHPGNLLVQPRSGTGPRLVLLDHGLTVPLEPGLVEALAQMVAALLDGDFVQLNRALSKAGMRLDGDLDVMTLLELVGVLMGGGQDSAPSTTVIGRQLGKSIGHIPTDLILVGRALGLLDGVTKQLDPDLNALEAIASYGAASNQTSRA